MKTLLALTLLLTSNYVLADQAYVICGKTNSRFLRPANGGQSKPGIPTNDARVALNNELVKVMQKEEAAGNRVEVSGPSFQRDTEIMASSRQEQEVDLACVTLTIRKK